MGWGLVGGERWVAHGGVQLAGGHELLWRQTKIKLEKKVVKPEL